VHGHAADDCNCLVVSCCFCHCASCNQHNCMSLPTSIKRLSRCCCSLCSSITCWHCAGVTDITDLVDRFLSQDDTEVTLHQLEQESQAYLQELQERSATLQVCLITASRNDLRMLMFAVIWSYQQIFLCMSSKGSGKPCAAAASKRSLFTRSANASQAHTCAQQVFSSVVGRHLQWQGLS